jgi:hypothetical protein
LISERIYTDEMPPAICETIGETCPGNQDGDSGVIQYERKTSGRIRRIKREVSAARLENGKRADDHCWRRLKAEPDYDIRADPKRSQRSRQLVRL